MKSVDIRRLRINATPPSKASSRTEKTQQGGRDHANNV